MKIKLTIVFMLVFALSIGAVSAADDEITDNTDIILISDNPTDDITDDSGDTDDGTIDDTSVIDDENNLYDPIYTIETGVEENSDETGSSEANNSTNNTVPMQTTGAPILPLALATLLVAGGVISTKLRK